VKAAQISGKVRKAGVRPNRLPSNPIGVAALTDDNVEEHHGCDGRLTAAERRARWMLHDAPKKPLHLDSAA